MKPFFVGSTGFVPYTQREAEMLDWLEGWFLRIAVVPIGLYVVSAESKVFV